MNKYDNLKEILRCDHVWQKELLFCLHHEYCRKCAVKKEDWDNEYRDQKESFNFRMRFADGSYVENSGTFGEIK